MKLEDDDAYLILDGLRRVYSAVKNGFDEVMCVVWDFKDKRKGKKMSRIISLMLNRHEPYRASELWNLMQILEDADELNSGMIEFLTQMGTGQAMKLKEVMRCEADYSDIREKLVADEIDIETAYKKLCNERKKENRLLKDDNTAVENTVSKELGAADDAQKLSDEETAEKLDLNIIPQSAGNLSEKDVDSLLEEAQNDDKTEPLEAMDMTNEIRGDDAYQTTDERHPVDKSVKQAAMIRDNFKCRCCGKGGAHWLGVLIYHHIVPVYAGGPDTVENGLTLCQDCHMTLHNYIMGLVQVNLDDLSDEDKEIFRLIFKYGNIALKATKQKKISRSELEKLDKTGKQHAYPDQYLKENTKMFEGAAANE
jgi:5-methylcytosine-specific restriction protein A